MNYPQVIYDMPFEDYKKAEGLNKSGMTDFWRSPLHYKKTISKPPTAPMIKGTAKHARILEPEKYNDIIQEQRAKTPKMDESGNIYLCAEHIAEVEETAKVASENELFSTLLNGAETEVSVFWEDEFNIICKARFDFINRDKWIIGDIKCCSEATYDFFRRQSENFKYHWQAAHYMDGALAVFGKPFNFIFFVFEAEPFPAMAIFKLGPMDIDKARTQIEWIKREYLKCIKENKWPCYPQNIQDMELRSWA